MDDNQNYIYGRNPVKERLKIIKSGTLYIKKGIQESAVTDLVRKARSKNINIEFTDPSFFSNNFNEKNHQGVILKIDDDFTETLSIESVLEKIQNNDTSILIILDGIEDVGNLGAIIRSALLFNADAVILPKNNSAPINDIVVKRSAGAVSFIDIVYVTNLVNTLNELKNCGYWIYGADMEGAEIISNVDFSKKSVLIMGDENKGIRKLVRENCDFIIKIPTNDKLDSLNVSVSAGIILYEMNKKISKV